VLASPRAARTAGIGMVHQHFTLIETLTVAENLALSLGQSRWRFDAASAAARAQALADRIGLDLSPANTRVSELPVGARQRLEIIKALAGAGRVLMLDEPTAVLTPQEVRHLFTMLRHLREQGRGVLFITHKLREVKEVADRVSIMRRGRVVATFPTGEISESEMAERMLGAVVPARQRARRAVGQADVALSVAGLGVLVGGGLHSLADVTFDVRPGEIVGIAGVDGNGQQELFEVLVGLRKPSGGAVRISGKVVTRFEPAVALAAGVAHIPPDRQREALVLPMSVRENFLLGRNILSRFSRHGILLREAARRFAGERVRAFAVRLSSFDAPVRSLSGGNQQRVVVARQLAQLPKVLIAVNPTRGLDVAAAAVVAEALIATADSGCAVLLISTDLDEVLELSDRVAVLFRGHLSTMLTPPIDVERLGLLMAGAA